ncbi:MAG TPA: cytochrome c [Saprospiraceae bacterium]|nr:cytochrome c [Saprospiraceae bacterium]
MKLLFPKIIFSLLLFIAAGGCQDNPYKQGQVLYENFCANCHMEDGSGLEGLIPPLAKADFLRLKSEQVPCIIRHGLKGEIRVNGRTYNQEMAAIPQLTDFEIANIINYIHQSWGNDLEYKTIQKIQKDLEDCAPAE